MNEMKEFRRVNNLTQDDLATYLGTGKSFISLVETGRSTLSGNKFSMILNNDKGWDTSMLPKKETGIPLIPIEVVAGWNGVDETGVTITDLDHYIIPEFVAAGAEYLIRVSGNSMYPKYSNGDILACRKIKEVTFFQWGKIYVIDSVQGAMVKRIFEGKDIDHVLCHSDNDKYPPFELPKSEIRSLSIVIGVVRLE